MDYIELNNRVALKDENGLIDLDKSREYDKSAAKSFFINNINKHTRFFYSLEEKLDYLISNKYWINFLELYSMDDIKQLFKLIYDKKFRFQSFMAASKFYQSYALRDDDASDGITYLERYEDRVIAVALFLANGDIELATKYANLMIDQKYQPATPTFLNAGRARAGLLVSCYLDEVGDSIRSIGYSISESMTLSSLGGGVAMNLSKLRARKDPIKGVEGRASGVLPVAKVLEDTFSYANQLGQRDGAGVAYLNIFHNDILEFLDSKKVNADEKARLKTLSTGIIIPDKFMELVRTQSTYYTFSPYSVYAKYHQYLDDLDMDEWYDKLISDPDIKATKSQYSALELLLKIAQVQKESGYPYLFFKGNANKHHALSNIGSVNFSNLCTEIMQVSEVTDAEDWSDDFSAGTGISCVLGSLNLPNAITSLRESTDLAIRMLDQVSGVINNYKDLLPPTIWRANKLRRSIGLGAMGLHALFAEHNVAYESEEAKDLANIIFQIINYQSLVTSNDLAMDNDESFIGFRGSDYQTGKYFDDYLSDLVTTPRTDKVKALVDQLGLEIPTLKDWSKLKESIMTYGLKNAYRLAIAPNQSTSYIMNSTASVMPISNAIETRVYGDSTTYYMAPGLSNDTLFAYKSAYDMDQSKVLELISVIQKHIDQGISTIIHSDTTSTKADLAKLYIKAWKLGLKALYYTRTRKSYISSANDLDCIACSV